MTKLNTEDAEPSRSNELTTEYGGAISALILVGGVGTLFIIAYSAQAQSFRQFFSIAAGGLIVSGASLLVGCLIGFLFGIPRSLQDERQIINTSNEETQIETTHGKARYKPNTNLEEISDWLTKILVGVGLTQIRAILNGLRSIGQLAAPVIGGFQNSEMFALGIFVYFSVCGFFISFLWARLTLPRLYGHADLASAERRGIKIGEEQFLASAQKASEAKMQTEEKYALWVDDNPGDNKGERELMKQLLGLEIKNVSSTEDAIKEIDREGEKYKLVISNLNRPNDRRAGFTLLEELKKMSYQKPIIFYTSYARRPQLLEEARERGAAGMTNSPQELLDLVRRALTQEG